MSEPISSSTTFVLLKYFIAFIIPLVEPQMAGILGALVYLMVRHELKMATLAVGSVLTVGFFGWMGAWATVNIFAEHETVANVYVQISSATVGFLSYDALLMFGKNSSSVLGFLTGLIKKTIERVVDKWNS